MRRALLLFSGLLFFAAGTDAQQVDTTKGYRFTDVKINPAAGVRNQQSSGTCWAFSGVSFLESELIGSGKGEYDLADMWIVRNNYYEKAVRYVRMHGDMAFGEGSITPNVFDMWSRYGIVPEEIYRGLEYGSDVHRHAELSTALQAYLDAIIKNPNRKLSSAWLRGVEGILDAYFGPKPEKFTYKGKEYTPQSFAQSLGLDMSDYATITSFSHHPFYKPFVLEVQDNWGSYETYNIPLDELEQTIDASLQAGHNVVWAADVSEKGFRYNEGFAVVPATKAADLGDSEKAKWSSLTDRELDSMALKMQSPGPEKNPTQELRQQEFDNYLTTDDHGMEIVGIAKDQNGTKYYKVKNSWGTTNAYGGYFYASRAFVLLKTTAIGVNRKAIPAATAQRLEFE